MLDQLSTIEEYATKYVAKLIDFLPTLIGALLLLVIGWWLIKLFLRKLAHVFEKREMDLALQKFLVSLLGVTLKIILFVIVISQLGIQTTSLIAIMGAAGLAIGLALQGSLANFAGGVIILVLRPFRIGDWVDTQGVYGEVTEIHLFYTKIKTVTNQLAVVPNAKVSNGSITNYSVLGIRRDFLTFNIGYKSDIKRAKEIIMNIMTGIDQTLEDPYPQVYVSNLGESYISLSARFWSKNEDFWDCHFAIIEAVQLQFADAGIELPFPQRNVHVQEEASK